MLTEKETHTATACHRRLPCTTAVPARSTTIRRKEATCLLPRHYRWHSATAVHLPGFVVAVPRSSPLDGWFFSTCCYRQLLDHSLPLYYEEAYACHAFFVDFNSVLRCYAVRSPQFILVLALFMRIAPYPRSEFTTFVLPRKKRKAVAVGSSVLAIPTLFYFLLLLPFTYLHLHISSAYVLYA